MTRKAWEPGPVIIDATADHTLTADESGAYISMTGSGSKRLILRPNTEHGLPDGGEWKIRNAAADGAIVLWPGDGVSMPLINGGTLAIRPGETRTLKRAAADVFHFECGSWTHRHVVTDNTSARNIVASDAWAYLRMTAPGAKTITFRPDATEALPNLASFLIMNAGDDGNVTLTAGVGVTLTPPEGGTLVMEPDMLATVTRTALNVFAVTGETVEA